MANVKSTAVELPDLDHLFSLHQAARASQDVDRLKQIDVAVQRIALAESAALEARILTMYHQETAQN